MGIPDQTGKVVVVTGGNTGIGKETAKALAAAGATVAITARTPSKGEAAAKEIKAVAGPTASVHVLPLDLSSLASVRACAAEVLSRFDRLDVLVNNAGAVIGDRRQTDDGLELTIGANHVGPFLFTTLLLDRLKASAPSRIVNLSSIAHRGASKVELGKAQAGTDDRPYNAMGRYSESKLANVLFTKELARRLEGTGVSAFAVHPGGVRSEFGKGDDTKGVLRLGVTLMGALSISPKTGASASLHCATEPGLEAKSGGYFQKQLFGNFGPVTEVQPTASGKDAEAARRLWDETEALLAEVSPA